MSDYNYNLTMVFTTDAGETKSITVADVDPLLENDKTRIENVMDVYIAEQPVDMTGELVEKKYATITKYSKQSFNFVDVDGGGESGGEDNGGGEEPIDPLAYFKQFGTIAEHKYFNIDNFSDIGEYSFNHTERLGDFLINDQQVYGEKLDLENRKIKVFYLGYETNRLATPQEVPLLDIDTFDYPSSLDANGEWIFDSTAADGKTVRFTHPSYGNKAYIIVRYL